MTGLVKPLSTEQAVVEESCPSMSVEEQEDTEMMPFDAPETRFSCKTFLKYMGPGWLMSLAYLDPGNLESDLQSGAYTGYSLVWVLFTCTMAGLLLQILAARLGVVTGYNLAQTCRMHYSRCTSLTIWIMTEVAIIGADVQEVVGSAIAFNILFGWPLWVGSVITGFDTFTFLLIHYCGKRFLEVFIFTLILLMMTCFFVNFAIMPPPASEIFGGMVPSCPSYAVLQLVGTVGAVIMPHNVYLHSALVQSRGVDRSNELHVRQANKYMALDSAVALILSFLINAALVTSFANGFFVTQCAENADTPLSCLSDATRASKNCQGMACNMCTTAEGQTGFCSEIGLQTAGSSLDALFGSNGVLAQKMFALGVLAAGQSSTMTGTFAGQYVMEGFVQWQVPIWLRTIITRSISLVPAIAVALLTQTSGNLGNVVNEWLNILQSVQLPFALLPILHFNADPSVMGRFVLQKRWRLICWLMALVVILINFYLVFTQFQGSSLGTWLVVGVVGLAYLFFLGVIIQRDLQNLWAFIRGRTGPQ